VNYEIIKTNFSEEIKRTDDNGTVWFIPIDPANKDYQEYLEQLEAEK